MAEPLDLIDAGRIHDRSKGTLRKTSLNHFKRYLQSTNSEFQTLDQFPENLIKDELLGKFSTYLKDHVESVKQYTTHKNYLSSLHQAIVEPVVELLQRLVVAELQHPSCWTSSSP